MSAEVIDYATGEVITDAGTDLVPADNMAALDSLDPQSREVAVTHMLAEARSWLAHAVEATEPQTIATFKAQMATIAEATKQLNLSKEIQMDALEMVRRAERGVGVAIRKGQAEGKIRSLKDNAAIRTNPGDDITRMPTAKDIAPDFYSNGSEMVAIADAEPEEFEDAITEAKSEGNLSRANVVRKIKGQQSGMTRDDRAKEIARLAGLGYSTRQIAPLIGIGEEAVYNIQRDYGIDIPADKYVKRTRRIDTNRIISQTVTTLEGIAMTLDLINPDDIDQDQAGTWLDSLTVSLKALSKAKRKIKESMR